MPYNFENHSENSTQSDNFASSEKTPAITNPFAERDFFLKNLVSQIENESLERKLKIIELVTRNSIKDGLDLANSLGVSPTEQFQTLIRTGDRENIDEVSELFRVLNSEKEYISDDHKELINQTRDKLSKRTEKGPNPDDFSPAKIPNKYREAISDYYIPFLKERKLKAKEKITSDGISDSVAEVFQRRKLTREPHYYSGPVLKHITEKTGLSEDATLEDHHVPSIISESNLEKILTEKGLNVQDFKKEKGVEYKPSEFLNEFQSKELERNLKLKIKKSLIQRGFEESEIEFKVSDGGQTEIILENESIKESNPEPFPAEYVKWGLEMMEKLLDEDIDKNSIARGLAGVSTPESIEFRQKLLDEGVNKNSIARGLAGVSTPESMEFRQKLLTEGVSKNSIARGLAGVSTPESMEFRQKLLLAENIDKDYIAWSLAGVSTPELMEFRQKLLLVEDIDKDYIAWGLTGVSTPESMEFRQKLLLTEGVSKNYITRSIFYDASENSGLGLLIIKLNSLNESVDGLDSAESEYLKLLNLLEKSDPEEEFRILEKMTVDPASEMSSSHSAAVAFNELIKNSPQTLFGKMKSKRENLRRWDMDIIAQKLFPEIRINKERERMSRSSDRGSFLGSIFGGAGAGGSRSEDFNNGLSDPMSYLKGRESFEVFGGDPNMAEGKEQEIVKFREKTSGMLVTELSIDCNSETGIWNKTEVPISDELDGPTIEISAIVNTESASGNITLPIFTDAKLIKERVKAVFDGNREEVVTAKKYPNGIVTVDIPAGAEKILYSQEKQEVPSIPDDLNDQEYEKFKKDFIKKHGNNAIESVAVLPDEISGFLDGIKNLSPLSKLIEIEKFARRISYYDFDNKEVMSLKSGKGNDERLAIMEMRMSEISAKQSDNSVIGTKYAGVCADFAVLTTAMLREAGFVSGIMNGLKVSGDTASVANAHSNSFVLWPNETGGQKAVVIDGTPDGAGVDEQGIIDQLRTKSLSERIEESKEKEEELVKYSEEKLAEIEKTLASYTEEDIKKLSNGELERILNIILKYKVKESHLNVVETVLSGARYSGVINLDNLNFANMDDQMLVLEFFEKEINRTRDNQERKRASGEKMSKVSAGKEFFNTIHEYMDRYRRDDSSYSTEEVANKLEKLISLTEKFLDPIETRAAIATINYLKAKNMLKKQ
jgi:hypothetical protein